MTTNEELGRRIKEHAKQLGITWNQYDDISAHIANADDRPARMRWIAEKVGVSEEVVLTILATFQTNQALENLKARRAW
jgi:hypothetical protein